MATVTAPSQTDTPGAAASARVLDKAQHLAVSYQGRGRFAVASGTRPGHVHTVEAPKGERDPEAWGCTCEWAARGGLLCSHVRAADLWLTRYEKRQARAAAKAEAVEAVPA